MKNIVLAGNPNCGKTMLFNRLTGGHMRVANFPGITVEKKEGRMLFGDGVVTDLPGTYSMNPLSAEEAVTGRWLRGGNYDVILNVADGTNLEKNLFLTFQLLELGKPVVVVLNMFDLTEKAGITINCKLLSALLGAEVVPVSAKNGLGVSAISSAIERAVIPPKPANENIHAEIEKILSMCVKKSGRRSASEKIDKVLLHPMLGVPIFIIIMAAVFAAVFSRPVTNLSVLLSGFFDDNLSPSLMRFLSGMGVNPSVRDFICGGIITGVGTVLSFLPQMSVLFGLLTVLEDSGYMSRAAFITDRPLKKLGLSGKSFVPILMGFGCTTSAILSARTISGPRSRLTTILILPFISCGARLPVYILFSEKFFGRKGVIVVAGMYFLGIAVAVISGLLFGGHKGDTFIMELPDYRMPSLKNVITETYIRIRSFITRAGTLIFIASALMWILENTSVHGQSPISIIGTAVAPIFAPLGFGFSVACASLISGLVAKEAIVSSLAILTGGMGIEGFFTAASALSFVVFAALYPPCISALSAMRREAGIGWMLFSFIYQLAAAYFCAMAVYFIAQGLNL
ncbi:MAG: ferrous iron transporter B [Bacillota bacterium]|nr:ferrous iron transporter B [Bacillota bacterium]